MVVRLLASHLFLLLAFMSLFSRLFSSSKPRLRRFPDSFTLTNARKLDTLCQWVREQSKIQTVVVLTHFQSTFLEVQQSLQSAEIEFEILAETLDPFQFDARLSERATFLTMSQMLQARSGDLPSQLATAEAPKKLAVMVTERYPIPDRDRQLEEFLAQLPLSISLGYVISFEDPILKFLLGQKFIDLMKQLGLGDNDLVSSVMTNRGFARKLKSATASIETEQLAESPQQWIELNLQETD